MYTQSFTLTVANVYGVAKPPIPPGYRVIEFRPPKDGEQYLLRRNKESYVICDASGAAEYICPRLILEKMPQVKQITITYTGEYRCPKLGEYYTYTRPDMTLPVVYLSAVPGLPCNSYILNVTGKMVDAQITD